MVSSARIKAFQKKVLSWYQKHGRTLPWRRTTDPYRILLSEIMLQQTQVDRVLGHYRRFLKAFATKKKLASADTRTLLSLWSGLGYNSRALRLRACAQELMRRRSFPSTEKELCTFPGIGPYTARAVLAFAFNKKTAVIDTNVRRVLIHELKLDQKITGRELETIALACVPRGQSRIWHNALMDYGALKLTAKQTGIPPLSKQSVFKGSTRQVRGAIVRHLLQHKKESAATLKRKYAHSSFDDILKKLLQEGIVRRDRDRILLSR